MYASSNPTGETETETCGGDDLLPEGVLIEILVWVPVISLLRFKSVCKSWRSLIQSPFFIDLHAATTSRFETFILQVFENPYKQESDESITVKRSESPTKMIMVTSEPETRGGGGGDEDEVFTFYDLGYLFYYTDLEMTESLRMVGSCNGLICLYDSKLKDVFLFNPATKQFRILPKSITIEEESITIEKEGIGKLSALMEVFVAFGFDIKTKDYKVVHITFFNSSFFLLKKNKEGNNNKERICRVQVYSLSTDSWRLLEGIDSLPIERPILTNCWLNHGIYLSGSYFFVGITYLSKLHGSAGPLRNDSVMMSFDFTTEIFTTVEFPDHDSQHKLFLSYLGDKIALFTTRKSVCGHDPNDYEYYEIWVLNEHPGSNISTVNKESWTKLHSFQMKLTPCTFPKCILNDGKFALITSWTGGTICCTLQLFNLVTKEAVSKVLVYHNVLSADAYNETLVSILSKNGAATADRVVGGAI